MRALVERGCGLCQNAMRAEGIKVLALMSCDVARMGTISCHVEAAKWDRILNVRALPHAERVSTVSKASWYLGLGLARARCVRRTSTCSPCVSMHKLLQVLESLLLYAPMLQSWAAP